MSGSLLAADRNLAIERVANRIEAHLVRLRQGHDPFGHLFAIERLARAARADWGEAEPGRSNS